MSSATIMWPLHEHSATAVITIVEIVDVGLDQRLLEIENAQMMQTLHIDKIEVK